jgi:hypothetical protein
MTVLELVLALARSAAAQGAQKDLLDNYFR